jgi:hypothetical protein
LSCTIAEACGGQITGGAFGLACAVVILDDGSTDSTPVI